MLEDGEERLVKPTVQEEGWTIETFKDRPVVKSPTTLAAVRFTPYWHIGADYQIGNLIQKLKDTRSRIKDGMAMAQEAACHMEEASPDDEVSKLNLADAGADRRWLDNSRRCSRVGSISSSS